MSSPSSPSPPSRQEAIRLREARREDIPVLVPMMVRAFRGRAMNEAFFPEHLRVRPGDADQLAFRAERVERRFAERDQEEEEEERRDRAHGSEDDGGLQLQQQQQPRRRRRKRYHYIVAVTEEGEGEGGGKGEAIVGYAAWVDAGIADVVPKVASSSTGEEAEGGEEEREARLEAERLAGTPPSLDREALATAQREIPELEKTLKEALGEEGFANSWCLDAIGVDPAHQRKGIGKLLMRYGAERAERDGKNVRFMASEAGAKMYRALGFEEVGSRDILGGMEYAFVRRAKAQ